MDNKLITGIIGVVVVVALLGSALVPVIDGLTEGEKTTNEGAGWIRMDYVTGANYSVDVSFDAQGNVKVDYGVPGSGMTDTQTHAADEDTILFASSEISMWLQDGVINILGKDIDGKVFFDQITESGPIAFLTKDGSGSEFNIDAGVITGLKASTWAYVPKTTGNFGFFAADTPVDMKDYPVAAVGGGFAGVYASNVAATYGLPLQMQTELDEDGKLIGGTWVKAAPEELNMMEFDPSTITIQPLDPSIIDLDPIDLGGGMQLMSVPTPTYTDGDWGYDTMTVSGSTVAKIVSYSGASGNIVVPSTVGGYSVYQLGKGGNSQTVFDNSAITGSTLTISDGIQVIADNALYYCSGFTGSLTIPDSVKSIGQLAFRNCTGFNGTLTLSSSLTTIGDYAFQNCSGLTGSLILPDGLTALNTSAFRGCNSFTGTVVIPNSVTSIGGEALAYCTKITGVVIPNSVTSIANYAFDGDSKLTEYVIASDAIPGGANTFAGYGSQSVLDLSDTVDYSVNHYGLAAGATYSDSIGDAIGYVSFVEIGTDPELSGGAAALLIAVPVVVIAGLLVAFVGYSIVKRY